MKLDYVKLTSEAAIKGFLYEQEFEFIKAYAADEERFDVGQLRCLWTAFCIHNDIEVDTAEYDNLVHDLWNIADKQCRWFSFNAFEMYLCKYLV